MNKKTFAAILLVIASIAQIIGGELPMLQHWGVDMATRSGQLTHPLVPYGFAFAIWGVIYLYSLVAAFNCLRPFVNQSEVFDKAVWPTIFMYAINTVWSLWVPFYGFDLISVGMILASLAVGLLTLRELGPKARHNAQTVWVFAPLALLTGWITVASVLNVTSYLVQINAILNPRLEWVSFVFLVGVITAGSILIFLVKSRVYSIPLVWALIWIMVANLVRAPSALMVNTAVVGLLVMLCIILFARIHREMGLKGEAQATLE